METKICKVCGNEKTITDFRLSRVGKHVSVCNSCVTAKLRENKALKRSQMGGG